MKRTAQTTSDEFPSWIKLVASALCLAAFVGFARFVSTAPVLSGSKDDCDFSPEAPSSYLRSSFAFSDAETYLDGRGRRFTSEPLNDEPVFVVASLDKSEETFKEPGEDGCALQEPAAEFVDEPEEEVAVEAPNFPSLFVEPEPDVPSFDEFASSDPATSDWGEDELICEFEDLRNEWAEFDERRKEDFALNGADFVDQFDNSLVTDDLFDSTATTAFIGQTNSSEGDEASEKKGEISQVSAVTPVKPSRAGRYVSRGAVGGSGEAVIQIP